MRLFAPFTVSLPIRFLFGPRGPATRAIPSLSARALSRRRWALAVHRTSLMCPSRLRGPPLVSCLRCLRPPRLPPSFLPLPVPLAGHFPHSHTLYGVSMRCRLVLWGGRGHVTRHNEKETTQRRRTTDLSLRGKHPLRVSPRIHTLTPVRRSAFVQGRRRGRCYGPPPPKYRSHRFERGSGRSSGVRVGRWWGEKALG